MGKEEVLSGRNEREVKGKMFILTESIVCVLVYPLFTVIFHHLVRSTIIYLFSICNEIEQFREESK